MIAEQTPRKRLLISADHGLAIVYFLQSEVVPHLLANGVEATLLTDDALVEQVEARFGRPGLTIGGLRLAQAERFERSHQPGVQWWLHFLRRVGGSNRINTEAMDSYIEQVAVEQSNWRRIWMPLAWLLIALLRRSRGLRSLLVDLQQRLVPGMYTDMLSSYRPDLVVASTPGWRLDRYLLREAHQAGIPTATVIVGWDNPSSYAIPGAKVDFATCWSAIQRDELVLGSDWDPTHVYHGGIPTYDGYLDGRWALDRQAYLRLHRLDPARKLLSYACSFVSFAPNWRNVETLVKLVESDRLDAPCQLLIRLHPNHFLDVHLFQEERQRIHDLANSSKHVRVVEPVPLGASLGHYSGEDMEEKASMLAHSDVFLTVYSTMVVEAAVHDRPIIALCLDQPGGWNWPRKYSLPLSQIGEWPTHHRFRRAGAGKVALSEDGVLQAINAYLQQPELDRAARLAFVEREITFTDGSAGRRTAENLLAMLARGGA